MAAITQKQAKKLVTWRDTPAGGLNGIVTYGLDQPHYIEIARGGAWAIQTLDSHDNPIFVDRGSARNVSKAKRAAEDAVRTLIDSDENDIRATRGLSYQQHEQPAWLRTVKVYIALSLFCFAGLLFARWMLIYRPSWFGRVLFWGGSSLILAHRIIIFVDNMSKKIEKLKKPSPSVTQRQPASVQSMQLPRKPKRKALPSGNKR